MTGRKGTVLAKTLDRRKFLAMAASAAAAVSLKSHAQTLEPEKPEVVLVPNFHPASCGWLTTFSRERVYCANSYFDHLDRVRDDAQYAFVLSEVNNAIAMMNFRPERTEELKQQIREGRVEIVNAFFLESAIDLSGGEALVRLGVEGLRWYKTVFDLKPRYAWNIDVCGTHEQMPQIAAGLGLEALIYTRKNPTGKTLYWSLSPDGTKILTLCPGHYSEQNEIFNTQTALNPDQLEKMEQSFAARETKTPKGAPVLVLAGSGDYSVAPVLKSYPSELLADWKAAGQTRQIRFGTLSDYIDEVRPSIDAAKIEIPTAQGGTAYDFDAFWIENNEVKIRYRHSEHELQAAENLATVASLTQQYEYPVQLLNNAWVLLCLNTDRNTLWGSAGGMVFTSDQSWDVRDRFDWIHTATESIREAASQALAGKGQYLAAYSSLNWVRRSPVELDVSAGKLIDGMKGERLPDGSVLCQPELSPVAVTTWKLRNGEYASAADASLPDNIETLHYTARIDKVTGNLTSLRLKSNNSELLGGDANVICAERPKTKIAAPADFMAPHPQREVVATSHDEASTVECKESDIALTVTVKGKFLGSELSRRVRLYKNHPRIDFETTLTDVPDHNVVVAQFPLASPVLEVRRGIPYGFAHSAWSRPNANLYSWNKGIVPAVRWMDFEFAENSGLAILDQGLSGRELDEQLAIIYLLNAESKYHGFENAWLTGLGKHVCSYSIVPRDAAWADASVIQAAWEYNQQVVALPAAKYLRPISYLETSNNVIVEAFRREDDYIELRLVECNGASGSAMVKLNLPHISASIVNLVGNPLSSFPKAPAYEISLRPQQIVTIHFKLASALKSAEVVKEWDSFVPAQKLAALHHYEPTLKGHPPFGDGVDF